jgi:hypothetical protein
MGTRLRKYIFTDRERAIIERFLSTGERVEGFKVIAYRVRSFDRLRGDVQLYMRFKDALAKSETAVPT